MQTKQWTVRNLVPALCIVALIGAALFSLVHTVPPSPLDSFIEYRVKLEGVVVRDADQRDKTVRLTVRPERLNEEPIRTPGNIIVSTNRFAEVAYGDRIEAVGVLQEPEAFETETGRVFNYPKYLETHGITHELPFADVTVLSNGNSNPVVAALLSVKHVLIRGIRAALPEPESALLEGLLLGEKQSLGDRIYKAFRKSGVVHIIVLSGYNVALVITAVTFIALRFLPRVFAYSLAALFVVGFAILTGGSETTIRATIMALLMMLAAVFHRPSAALRGLLIAAALMALINPLLVLHDLSFQLSVLATLGLILFSDWIGRRAWFVSGTFGFREIVATTLATQVTVLPLLIFSIGAVSLVFLPANILILPAVPLAMLVGFIAALLALVSPVLALPVTALAYGVLKYIIAVALFFGELPFSIIEIPPAWTWMALGVLAVLYGIAGSLIYLRAQNQK